MSLSAQDIDELLVRVYRARLDAECSGDADRQVAKDGDAGLRQSRRAEIYRPVVIETLVQAGLYQRPVRAPVRLKSGEAS